jgi:hypothetical protein
VSRFLRELTVPPPPLTHRTVLVVGAIVVGISRWFALSKSQLDWDESLFAGGVRNYDVIAQNPHPPGYPLFILFAKIVRLLVHDDFRSLQAVVAVSSVLLFPATFFLLRELRWRFRLAIAGAIITAFLPTVWYYGGTALSDVPALCAVVIASALLLAGGRNPRAWIAGMFVAGIAGGIRPLHVVIAAVPALIGAVALRRSRAIVTGCVVFVFVVLASYTGAAMATPNPPWGYLRQIATTARHIGTVDSFNNVNRPPLPKLAPAFFLYPHRGGRAGIALLVLTAIGLIAAVFRRDITIAILLAMFAPIAIISWMMFDVTAVTRYGLAYVMLYSTIGAYGIDVIAQAARNATVQNALIAAAAALIVWTMIDWTWPALALVRRQASPPIVAMQWIRANVPRSGPHLYLDDSLGFHAWHELPGYDMRFFNAYDEIPAEAYIPGNYCLVDRRTIQPHALYFRYPHGRLAQVARDFYFDVSVIPMNAMIRFADGWYQDEWDESRDHAWRWMRKSSTTLLPPIGSQGVLRLVFHLPLDALPRPMKIIVMWNGALIEQTVSDQLDNDRRYLLASRTGVPNELRILVDQTARANGDPRELGLELLAVSWERTDGP